MKTFRFIVKNALLDLLAISISFTLSYLMSAFVEAKLNFKLWSEDTRALTIILTITFSVALVALYSVVSRDHKSTN